MAAKALLHMSHDDAYLQKLPVTVNQLYIAPSGIKVSGIIFNIFPETWLVPLPNLVPVKLAQRIPTEAKVSSTQTLCSFMRKPNSGNTC